MDKKRLCLVIGLCAILAVQCGGKKEKETPEEDAAVEVEIPEVGWEKSIAILPVQHDGTSPKDRALAGVVAQKLASDLSRSGNLKIITIPEGKAAHRESVQADYILQGEVREEAGQIQASFRLTEAQKDTPSWATSTEDASESVLIVSEQASTSILSNLSQESGIEESAPQDPSPQSMKRYLQAKAYLEKKTRDDTNLAIQELKTALEEDPSFALAALGLAESYLGIVENGWDHKPLWLSLAQEACLKAIAIDGNLAEAYLRLGQIHLLRGDDKHAEDVFFQALSINTNLEEAWVGLGTVFSHYGLYEPCLDVYEKALSLNPASGSTALSRAMILIGLTRYAEAEETIRGVMRFHTEEKHFHSFLALTRFYQNDLTGALTELEQGMASEQFGPFSHAVKAMILAKQDKLDESLGELELEVKPYVGDDASLATAVAAVYSLIGQNGQAVQWLEKAVSWGYGEYLWLAKDPNFENIREDERFTSLMRGLKAAWRANTRRYAATD